MANASQYTVSRLTEKIEQLSGRLREKDELIHSYENLYEKAPLAHLIIDRANIVRDTNRKMADLLGLAEDMLIGKPVTGLVLQEDLAIFFLNRNLVFSNQNPGAFELRFRDRQSDPVYTMVECEIVDTDGMGNPQNMRMCARDISDTQMILETLRFKDDLLKILFSISREMAGSAGQDAEEVIGYCLKTMGIFSDVRHSFIALFQDNGKKISISHEWYAQENPSVKCILEHNDVENFFRILAELKRNEPLKITDIERVDPEIRLELEKMCTPRVQSLVMVPITLKNAMIGIIGLDSDRTRAGWNEDILSLMKFVGDFFLNTWMLSQMAPAEMKRSDLIQSETIRLEKSGGMAESRAWDSDPVFLESLIESGFENYEKFEFDGDSDKQMLDSQREEDTNHEETYDERTISWNGWRLCTAWESNVSNIQVIHISDKDQLQLICPNCYKTGKIPARDVEPCGHLFNAQCECGTNFTVKAESRETYRKKVKLEGLFIKQSRLDDPYSLDAQWGNLVIENLSKTGVGFSVLGNYIVKVGDKFRIKFTLDNSARSLIEKDVVVKSVRGNQVGCQFLGTDKHDITLGFYLI